MRIVIVAVGSLGDVAPYTGLAARLRRAGHEVTIAAHEPYKDYVQARGLPFHPLPLDLRAELATSEGRRALGTSPAALARFTRMYAARWAEMGEAILAAAQHADALLLSAMGWLGIHVAEGLGIPSMGVYLQPMDPTREFPPAVLTTRSLGGPGNRAAAHALRVTGQAPFRSVVKDLRTRLGLPPIGAAALFRRLERDAWPVQYGFSPFVVPPPRDWPPGREVTGYWWPEPAPGWTPPDELVDFLESGPPPVFVGFGSMNVGDAEKTGWTVTDALRRNELRGIVQSRDGTLAAGTRGDILSIGDVPHDWLFPKVAAVVHHGGAGTTAAGLRAGVPAVTLPLAADQPFWAARVHAIGCGPRPVPFRRLNTAALAQAIGEAVSDGHRERAREVARIIAKEDGARRVVKAVERLVAR